MLTQSNLGKTLLVASALGAGLGSMPALAAQSEPVVVYGQQDENTRTERVSFADLNLAKAKDARKLHFRVASAVKRVCLYDTAQMGLRDAGYGRCSSGAWTMAKPQIAQAIARDQEIALNGSSSIAAVAITIAAR
ncbi:UrcA family protein [Sphingomonas edaphi]|nr:UrcA family protein [Sphingomonas edaphi]